MGEGIARGSYPITNGAWGESISPRDGLCPSENDFVESKVYVQSVARCSKMLRVAGSEDYPTWLCEIWGQVVGIGRYVSNPIVCMIHHNSGDILDEIIWTLSVTVWRQRILFFILSMLISEGKGHLPKPHTSAWNED